MKPIPVAFHIGPLEVHTYGIGLALTFWFAYRYFARRLRAHGYPDQWLGRAFIWIIVASIVGARAVHVIANWGFYAKNAGDILAVWHGGLSSFGGLALGVPAGIISARRWCKELRLTIALDLVAPVLVLAWSIGRLLGPQLMVAGGGRPTTAWYGMYYAGQVGRRVPVPILQAIECFVIWLIVLQVERFVSRRGRPLGLVVTVGASLYGLSRFFDEYIWLPHGRGGVAVEMASLAFVGVGALFAGWLLWRERSADARQGSAGSDPWASPLGVPASGTEDGPDGATSALEAGPAGPGTVSESGAHLSDTVPFA